MSILITGSSGYIGTQLCKRFEKDGSVNEVVGLDLVPPKESFTKLVFYEKDCTSDLSRVFEQHQIETVVHLVFVLNPIHDGDKMYRINVGSLENILANVEKYGVKRLVVTSSYTAYGAHPDNPDWLTEDHPLRGNPDFQYARDKTIVEERLKAFKENHPDRETVVVRPSLVLGPNISNFISRYLDKSVVPLVKDVDYEMQFLHEDDAADALFRLVTEAPEGVYNVGPPSTIHPAEAARIMGRRLVSLRPGVLRFFTALGWKLRITSLSEAPSSMISFIQHPCLIDGHKIERVTSFRYRYTSTDAVQALAAARSN